MSKFKFAGLPHENIDERTLESSATDMVEETSDTVVNENVLGPDRALAILQDNPKKSGSLSHARYDRYKLAKTLSQFYALGGTKGDLTNDTAKGYIVYEATADRTRPARSPPSHIYSSDCTGFFRGDELFF